GDEMVKSDSGCTGDLDWWLALICAFSRYQETVGKSQTHSARQIVDVYPLLFRQSTPTLREGRDRSGGHRHAAADRCHRATSRRSRLFRRRRPLGPRGDEGAAAENDHVHSNPAKLQPYRTAGNGTSKNKERRGQRYRVVGALAAITVMKRQGNEKVAYISTNTTPNSYTALLGKATDAAIL